MELLSNASRNLLDTANCLYVKLLGGELNGRIARMNSGKLDVFRNGIGNDFAVTGHRIHLHFLRILHKLGDDHGVLLRDICRKTQEAFQLLLVGADIHGSSRQDV